MRLTKLFSDFSDSEKTGGMLLLLCTMVSLALANFVGPSYIGFWHLDILSRPLEFWINDGLMTIFFLLVGLEMERELYIGELADLRKSLLPVIGALGGMLVPAAIYLAFTHGTPSQRGFGIPMATDIAFSLAVLSLLGSRVPASLKIFLTALAIIDDLGAIIVIALFYSTGFSLMNFALAMMLFVIMLVLNRLRFYQVWVYLVLGAAMWFCMLSSGIHPTITGVLLAFAIPFGNGDERSPSYGLQSRLHKPVAFVILPLFALANTAIAFSPAVFAHLTAAPYSSGIIYGLLFGKPLGIFLFAVTGTAIGVCSLPEDVSKPQLLAAAMLAGIGFTMSIFITLLAFTDTAAIETAKVAVMMGSLLSGIAGYAALRLSLKRV